MRQLVSACVTIQAAWRGFLARATDIRCASARREIRSRRVEKHIRLLSSDVQLLHGRIAADEERRALQSEALQIVWRQVQGAMPSTSV